MRAGTNFQSGENQTSVAVLAVQFLPCNIDKVTGYLFQYFPSQSSNSSSFHAEKHHLSNSIHRINNENVGSSYRASGPYITSCSRYQIY